MSGTEGNLGDFDPETLNKSLCSDTHQIEKTEAEALLLRYYGISGSAFPLLSERDQNFKIVDADGAEYIFKLSNAAEDPAIAEAQVEALLHITSVDPLLPIPRVCPALDGRRCLSLFFHTPDGDLSHTARLLSFLPGRPLNTVSATAAQRRALGALLARLGLALRGFSHPAADHDLAWDIKNVSKLGSLLSQLPDASRRQLARHFLENFEAHAAPVLPSLRAQVVHNDLNAHNVLVDPEDHDKIVGLFDFGDMVYTSLINDVAVAASYHLPTGEQALEAAAEFVAAYHDVVPLEPIEVDLLYDLIAGRFLATVAITGWRARRFPENSEYILRNNPAAWAGLEALYAIPREQAQLRLRQACHME